MWIIGRELAMVATVIAATLVLVHFLRQKRPAKRTLLAVAFTLYVGAVVAITLFPIQTLNPLMSAAGYNGMPYNFVPFEGVARTIAYGNELELSWLFWDNIAGNVIMFVPLGVMVPLLSRKVRSFGIVALVVLAATVGIELSQLIMGLVTGYPFGFSYRVVDTTDIILNFIGGLVGYGLFRIGAALAARQK